jgi:signal peptidase I
MEPNFYDHEYLIIDEISYRFNDPKRGDIVVFRYPLNPQEYFIKRIIGLPGEKVEIKDGEVRVINKEHPEGIVINEPYLMAGTKSYSTDEDPVALSDKEYFVMGDNRNASKDSRSFGPINRSFLTGKVLLRGWPFNRVNVFETPAYQF